MNEILQLHGKSLLLCVITYLGGPSGAGFARPAKVGGPGRCWERAESWRLSFAKPVSTPAAAVIPNLQARRKGDG